MNLISEARKRYPTCPLPELEKLREKPVDCFDVLEQGQNTSGIYTVWPRSRIAGPLVVFCDMETDGGGWTVIQRRGNFTVQEDFYRNWNDYKIGFGNVTRDFWIGNDNIFYLSNQGLSSIRFDLKDVKGDSGFALYKEFWIEDETTNYTLHVSNYSGNAGNCMTYHNNMMFSTKDRINDKHSTESCAVERQSGWWFNKCDYCNPNGLYKPGADSFKANYWYYWKKAIGLATVEIKLRRM